MPFSKFLRRLHPGLEDGQRLVSYYLGTGHAIKREVMDQVGFYEGRLTFGNEELDLSYRVVENGYKILYVPNIVVHHYPEDPVTFGHGGSSELYYYTRSRLWLAFKYLPFPYLPVYVLMWLGAYGITALRTGDLRNFFKGVVDGLKMAGNSKRSPLGEDAIAYLRGNFGRLWY